MAGNRREFLKAALAFAAALATPASRLWQAAERRVLEAVRAKHYPGPMKELRPEEIEKPADWAG